MSTPTHCPHGHLYDETNTYWQVRPNGHKTATCRTCQRTRIKGNSAYHRVYMQKWRAANIERDRDNWRSNRKRKKAWLTSQKIACIRCGESDPVCLDFHHRDPSNKELVLSVAIAHASFKRIKEEAAKCDILCANCHRKLHAAERAA